MLMGDFNVYEQGTAGETGSALQYLFDCTFLGKCLTPDADVSGQRWGGLEQYTGMQSVLRHALT